MSRKRILYDRKAILDDVENVAFVLGDVREGEYSPHALHHIFDICAEGNIDLINRILDLGIAEVEAMVYGALDRRNVPHDKTRDDREWRLIRTAVHEYLVAMVMAGWLVVALPPGASVAVNSGGSRTTGDALLQIWKERKEAARNSLAGALSGIGGIYAFRRRISPI